VTKDEVNPIPESQKKNHPRSHQKKDIKEEKRGDENEGFAEGNFHESKRGKSRRTSERNQKDQKNHTLVQSGGVRNAVMNITSKAQRPQGKPDSKGGGDPYVGRKRVHTKKEREPSWSEHRQDKGKEETAGGEKRSRVLMGKKKTKKKPRGGNPATEVRKRPG